MSDLGAAISDFRRRRGLKQFELARLAQMTAAQLSMIENNRVSPSFHAVERLVRALDTNLVELFAPNGEKSAEKIDARADVGVSSDDGVDGCALTPVRQIEPDAPQALAAIRAEEAAADAVERARGLVNTCTISFANVTASKAGTAMTGTLVAELARGDLGLGVAPIGNLAAILAFRGVRIYSCALPRLTQSISFWSAGRRAPVFVLNSGNTAERAIYRLAYELASVYLYHATGRRIDETLDEHRFLRDFTAAFLMPGLTVRQYVASTGLGPDDWTFDRLVAVKSVFHVSAEAFALRLEELALISPAIRLALRERLRAYYTEHPGDMEPQPAISAISRGTILEIVPAIHTQGAV